LKTAPQCEEFYRDWYAYFYNIPGINIQLLRYAREYMPSSCESDKFWSDSYKDRLSISSLDPRILFSVFKPGKNGPVLRNKESAERLAKTFFALGLPTILLGWNPAVKNDFVRTYYNEKRRMRLKTAKNHHVLWENVFEKYHMFSSACSKKHQAYLWNYLLRYPLFMNAHLLNKKKDFFRYADTELKKHEATISFRKFKRDIKNLYSDNLNRPPYFPRHNSMLTTEEYFKQQFAFNSEYEKPCECFARVYVRRWKPKIYKTEEYLYPRDIDREELGILRSRRFGTYRYYNNKQKRLEIQKRNYPWAHITWLSREAWGPKARNLYNRIIKSAQVWDQEHSDFLAKKRRTKTHKKRELPAIIKGWWNSKN
jgi:hypothetical protein